MKMSDEDVKEEQGKFADVCSDIFNSTSIDYNDQFNVELKEYQSKIKSLKTSLIREIRRMLQFQRTAKDNKSLADWEQEFQRIISHPQVEEVEIDSISVTITVFTTVIYCRNPDTNIIHELGKFRIVIPMWEGEILWINRTRSVRIPAKSWIMQAPHVLTDTGNACLGTYHGLFAELLANYEYAAVVSMAITFLESVDPDDSAGRYITKFPIAEV